MPHKNGKPHARQEMEDNPVGLPEKAAREMASALDRHQASLFVLFHQYQKHHWVVVGPQFRDLHLFFQEAYEHVHKHLDALAERVTLLGGVPTASPTALAGPPDPPIDGTVYALLADNSLVVLDGTTLAVVAELTIELPGGERVLSIDFRPSSQDLFGVGDAGGVNRIDPDTAVATQVVGGPIAGLAPTGAHYGIDYDVDVLVTIQPGLHPVGTLADSVDAVVESPGLGLSFGRAYTNSILGRYELGVLGRGWHTPWEERLVIQPEVSAFRIKPLFFQIVAIVAIEITDRAYGLNHDLKLTRSRFQGLTSVTVLRTLLKNSRGVIPRRYRRLQRYSGAKT